MPKKPSNIPQPQTSSLIQIGSGSLMERVVSILEQARANVARSVNSNMVIAYWLIGHEIVEELQSGEGRAGYGQKLLNELSERLTKRYGQGFSATNLRYFRLFYQSFSDRVPEIHHTPSDELAFTQEAVLGDVSKAQERTDKLAGFSPNLSWSHYRALSKIESRAERRFYEIEADRGGWSLSFMERQIHSLLFARLLKSRDKAGVLALAQQGQTISQPINAESIFMRTPRSMVATCCHLVVFLLRIMGTSFNMAINLSAALKRPVRSFGAITDSNASSFMLGSARV
jgi:hypothetical protein